MTVTPLRSKARLADVPWIGVGVPVAIVTVSDPDIDRRLLVVNLRRRFGLTAAESRLAAEILKGDGRAATAHGGAASLPRRPKPTFRAFSRRPEPTGKLNSSVTCSTPPMGTRSKYERFRRCRRQGQSPHLQGSRQASNNCYLSKQSTASGMPRFVLHGALFRQNDIENDVLMF